MTDLEHNPRPDKTAIILFCIILFFTLFSLCKEARTQDTIIPWNYSFSDSLDNPLELEDPLSLYYDQSKFIIQRFIADQDTFYFSNQLLYDKLVDTMKVGGNFYAYTENPHHRIDILDLMALSSMRKAFLMLLCSDFNVEQKYSSQWLLELQQDIEVPGDSIMQGEEFFFNKTFFDEPTGGNAVNSFTLFYPFGPVLYEWKFLRLLPQLE